MHWSNEQSTALHNILVSLLRTGRQMLAVLTAERDALIQREPPAASITEEKAQLASILADMHGTYDQLIDGRNIVDLRQQLASEAPDLILLLDDVKAILNDCDEYNHINGRLLARTHIKYQLLNRLLKNSHPDPTYSRGGQLSESNHGSLGKA
ncbi:flagellar export chaperone FlgN [Salinispirillum marinum]|uniref:Flagellar export chaperone FlgN n=2 Tax=Saccharospirillaceae TaxID=255527 RepID=A0ABV8BHF1_9GAMM